MAGITSWPHQVERSLGQVDLLVNNAGVIGPLGPLWEADHHEWWQEHLDGIRNHYSRIVLQGRSWVRETTGIAALHHSRLPVHRIVFDNGLRECL